MNTQRIDHVGQKESSHLQGQERGLRINQICRHLEIGLLASRILKKCISVVEATPSVVFCYGSSNKLIYPYHPQANLSLDTLHTRWVPEAPCTVISSHPRDPQYSAPSPITTCVTLLCGDCRQSWPTQIISSPRQGCILFLFASTVPNSA